MYGLAAIEQANGWAMAAAGACIVLTGLTVLSFLISMIPRLTGLFEKKPQPPVESDKETVPEKKAGPETYPENTMEASKWFTERTERLGEDFSLVELHKILKEMGVVDPHMMINRFREAGTLISSSEGCFSWKPVSD